LPASLARSSVTFLPAKTVMGHPATGVRYSSPHAGRTTTITAWVDSDTGLTLRLVRVESRGAHVIERDVADYTYSRTR
jgi:hypothetical protein